MIGGGDGGTGYGNEYLVPRADFNASPPCGRLGQEHPA